MKQYAKDMGELCASGKTKRIYPSHSDPFVGYAFNRDAVTWGNVHSMRMPGKGRWSTTVNHNMCGLFMRSGLPVAYRDWVSDRAFRTELCDMLPFEVIAVGIVDGKSSFRKRNPEIAVGHVFENPIIQFHLKTSGQVYRDQALPVDDPLMVFGPEEVHIYLPGLPLEAQEPIFSVPLEEAPHIFPGYELIEDMRSLAGRAYLAARSALHPLGGRFFDMKLEFGRARRPALMGKLLIADVCDADSVRMTVDGLRADKQLIRDGGEAAYAAQVAAYQRAVEITNLLAA